MEQTKARIDALIQGLPAGAPLRRQMEMYNTQLATLKTAKDDLNGSLKRLTDLNPSENPHDPNKVIFHGANILEPSIENQTAEAARQEGRQVQTAG